ncbi:PspA/IM30 family protein [Komarekiella delphini-convector]|uniref:PspA/IM30 family protein n=1 Tax=Komarekiella delphini-convector TaxID=3050158 RepID=UPI0017853DA4|nr:PspA/IM30 family protein [Komarekiella delphini-convector]
MGIGNRISRIIRTNLNDMAANFKYGESTAFIAGGAATGAVVSQTVGGMGLAFAGTAIGIGAPHLIATGVVTGIAAYGTKKAIENQEPLALSAAGLGAIGGAGVSTTVGNMGLLAAGSGFSIGMAPVVAAGAVVGLGAYGLLRLLNEGQDHNDPNKVVESVNQIKLSILQSIHSVKDSKEEIQANYKQAQNEVQNWHQIAVLAMKKGREDLAREALTRKYNQQQIAESLKTQLEQLIIEVHSLKSEQIITNS